MRPLASLIAACGFAGCATAAIFDDDDAPAVVVQAVDLTCGWLLDSSPPPARKEMERLSWSQFMKRGDLPPAFFASQTLDPALAGYRLRFGEAGDIIASHWDIRCYGILSADRMPEDSPYRTARAEQALVVLEAWVMERMPDALPGQLAFESGEEKPYVARIDHRFAFSAVVLERGGLEWRLTPTDMIGAIDDPANRDDETTPQ